MKSKIGVGIIGCGLMGGIHAECYAREKNCEIIGFQNRSRDKAEKLAQQHGAQVYDTVEQLLADPRIDAVSITSSQQVHAEQVIAAAKAGKHIMCEKPLGLTIAEFDAMEKAVKKAGVTVMVAHQLRFHPVVEWVQKNLRKLGPVYHLDLEMTFRIDVDSGRCWADYRSGGFFMELGCHMADLAHHLMGEVRHVSAHTLRLNPRRVTEDFTQCMLQFENGANASIIVSANHRTHRQGLLRGRVLGAKGRIDFSIYPYARNNNSAKLVLDGGKSIFVPDVQTTEMPKEFPKSLTKEVYAGFFDVYQREIHAFLEAVRKGVEPPVTFADGRTAVEVVLAAYHDQAEITDKPNFRRGAKGYRSEAASHPALKA